MTNERLLRAKIDEHGLKLRFVAAKCGLSYQGFLNKMTNQSEFTAPEMRTLRELLGLSLDEMDAIFFASEVDKASTN
jgi:hypothetical protein